MSEVQQNESYLRGRVEELEVTENMLKETLHQADQIMAQRERKLRDQVCWLQIGHLLISLLVIYFKTK